MASYYETHKPTGVHPDTRTQEERDAAYAEAEKALDARFAQPDEFRSTTNQKWPDAQMRDAGFVMETDLSGQSRWFRPFPVTPYGGTK
jgi:hypothetical protein